MLNRTNKLNLLIAVLLLLFLSTYPTQAQSGTGSVSGTITSSSPISSDAMTNLTVQLYKDLNDSEGPPDWFPTHFNSTYVNADGTYTVSNLDTGTYRVGVSDNNYPELFQNQYFSNATTVEDATDIIIDEGANITDIDIEISELGKIAGTVTDMDGNPVENVWVKAFHNTYGYWAEHENTTWEPVLTETDGSYLLSGLQPGNIRLQFDGNYYGVQPPGHAAEFYNDAVDVESATDIAVALNETVLGIDAQLVRLATISGKVTDLDGNPLADAHVSLYQQTDDGSFINGRAAATTDQNGNYTVAGLEAGTYRMYISANSSSSGSFTSEYYQNATDLENATDIVVEESENVSGINIELDALGKISGTVTDMDGNALENIFVRAYQMYSGFWEPRAIAYTESDGSYLLMGLSPEAARIQFEVTAEQAHDYSGYEAPSYAMEYYDDAPDIDAATDIVVSLNSNISGIDAQLADLASISGTVTAPNGSPITGASVNMYKQRDNGIFFNISNTTTNQNGEYTVDGLDAGTYRLGVQQSSQSQWADEFYNNAASLDSATDIVIETSAVLTDFDIQLEGLGQISGTVTDEENNPIADIPVILYRDADWFGEWIEESMISTDESGTYEFSDLPSGEYYIGFATNIEPSDSVYIAEYYDDKPDRYGAAEIIVGAGSPTSNIDAQLAKAGSIRGIVTDSAGNPLPEIAIELLAPPYEFISKSLITDDSGRYSFYGLSTGAYRIHVYDPEWNYQSIYYENAQTIESATDIMVNGGQETNGIDIMLNKKSTISGRVLDVNGNLITGARLEIVLYTYNDYLNQWSENIGSEHVRNGEYMLENLADNTYRLQVRHSTFSDRQYHTVFYPNAVDVESGIDITVSDGDAVVLDDMVLDRLGSISGVVTNTQGQPVGGIIVKSYRYAVYDDYWSERHETRTNGDGTYTLESVEVGTYKVLFTDREYIDDDFEYAREYYNNAPDLESAMDIIVPLSENVVGIDAELGPPSRITGKVNDENGNPLSNIGITLFEQRESDDGGIYWDYWDGEEYPRTNERGEFSFGSNDELLPGKYRACFNDNNDEFVYQCYGGTKDESDATDIIVGLNETVNNINMTMVAPGTISGKVSTADGSALEDVEVTLYRYHVDRDEWLEVERFAGSEFTTTTDENGGYEVLRLLPGTYRIEFTGDVSYGQQFYAGASAFDEATDIEIASGQSIPNVDIQLVKRTTIMGKVTDENNVPLQSIFVGVYQKAAVGAAQVNTAQVNTAQVNTTQVNPTPLTETWDLVRSETTNAFGQYTIYDLAPGTYRIGFNNSDALYHSEFYGNDAYYISQAADVVINVGSQIENIDAILSGISLNVPPLAITDAMQVDEAGETTELVGARRSLLANDEDAENTPLTAMLIISPTHGLLELNADGTFSYQHDGSETLTDEFSYVASDGLHESDVISVTIQIQPQNDAPIAMVDTITVEQGSSASTLSTGETSVLINDSDAENDNLSVELDTAPTAGMITLNADGTFSYQHDGSDSLSDSFTYFVSDGTNMSDSATVTINVTATNPAGENNSAPIATEDSVVVEQGGTASILSTGELSVLFNDSDAENDELSVEVVAEPLAGTLTLNADGTFIYQHDGSGTLSDSFTYSVSDGTNMSDPATVTINVTATDPAGENNSAPVATEDSMVVEQGGTASTLSTGELSVLFNDSDAENDELSVEVVAEPQAGTLTLNADGTFIYQHDGSGTLSDSFTYVVSDGVNRSDAATVTINVIERTPAAENNRPIAAEDSITVSQGGMADKLATGEISVVLNDSDAEDSDLTVILVDEPQFGTLTLNADGSFIYQHNGGDHTTDSFTYKVSDGQSESEPAMVTIQVMPASSSSSLYLPMVAR